MSQAQTQIRDFTHGNVTRQLLVFAWPLFLSNLLQVVYNMVDMMVVGNVLGQVGTSAVSIGGEVSSLLTFVAIGFSSAGQVIIARFIGAGRRDTLARFVGTMCGFMMVWALILSVFGLTFQQQMLGMLNTPEAVWEGAVAYSAVCMTGLVFIVGYNMVSAILRGMGDGRHPLIFIAISACINLVLDIIFVAFWDMGPAGAAYATVISQGISFLVGALYLVRHAEEYALNIRMGQFFRWDGEMLSMLMKLGIPMAIKSAAVHISRIFVLAHINAYGVAVSAFSGIAHKLSMVSNLISNSMNAAGSTVVGQNIAAGEFGRTKQVLLRIIMITCTASAILSMAYTLFPEQIISLFTDEGDAAVIALAAGYIPIAILMFFSSATRAVTNALINGSGNTRINFITAFLDGFIMRIGLAVLFGIMLEMGYFGLWLGDALAGYTPGIIGLGFYLSGRWKKGKMVAD